MTSSAWRWKASGGLSYTDSSDFRYALFYVAKPIIRAIRSGGGGRRNRRTGHGPLRPARAGLQVVRDPIAMPRRMAASVRNFGFVLVTGQERGSMWARARRSREVWRELADAAGVFDRPLGNVDDRQTSRVCRCTRGIHGDRDGRAGCRLLTPAEARRRCPQLLAPKLAAVLESTIELRVGVATGDSARPCGLA